MPDAPAQHQPFAVIKTDCQIASIRFSPCGRYLFAAGRDAKIHRWDLEPPVSALEVANEGASDTKSKPANQNQPRIVDRHILELPALNGHNGWVSSIAFSSSGQRLYSADTWGRLIGWNLNGDVATLSWSLANAHDGWIRQLAISPNGRSVATCGMDRRIRLWSTDDGTKQAEFDTHSDDLYSLAFHPDGTSLMVGDLKGVITHWELSTRKPIREFDARIFYKQSYIQDVGGVRWLAFDSDGKTLVAAGAQPDSGGFVQAIPTLRFFDWSNGKETQTLTLGDNPDGFVHEIAFHAQGYWIGVCSGQPGRGKFFFHREGKDQPFFTSTTPLANCHSIALHPNGTRFAVISNAGTFGQQKSMARQGVYPGNSSPINIFDLPAVPL